LTTHPRIHDDARVARVVHFYTQLQPSSLAQMGEVYAANASFKDPFNTVQGLPSVRAIFEHMFARYDEARFVVTDASLQGDASFMVWDFSCVSKTDPTSRLSIHGASHLRFDAQGLVAYHRDYWDAAEEVYEKLPVLGAVLRAIKKRGAAT
jgi:steroid Delta-isomerase